MVSDVLEDQQQISLTAQKEEGRVRDSAIPVAPLKNKGDGEKEEIANSGHRKARIQEAQNERSSTTTELEEREYDKDSLLEIQKLATGQAQESGKEGPCFSHQKGSCLKDKNCDFWHPPFCVFQNIFMTMQIRYERCVRPYRRI